MNHIKTIIVDLDGTLLNHQSEINMKTKETLIKAQENGIKLILASGRPTSAITRFALELEMNHHHGLIISFNGACIVDVESNEILYSQPVHKEYATKILKHIENFDVFAMVTNDNIMYVEDVFNGHVDLGGYYEEELKNFDAIHHESRGGNYLLHEVSNLANFVDFPLYKILIAGDADYLQDNQEQLFTPFLDHVNGVFSAPFYYEITDKNIDKGYTIKYQLSKLGYNPDEIIAFGDGHNDISMLENVGIGVAMKNAEKEVLEIADEVTLSNLDDGIAVKLIEKLPHIFE